MRYDQRGVSPIALILLIFLVIAIIAVSTVLVGRALGWWAYADLPVIGKLFPAPPAETAEDPAPDGVAVVDPTVALNAELAAKNQLVADLQLSLQRKDQELFTLSQQIASLNAKLSTEDGATALERWKETARMLQNMRAEQAAAIITHYSDQEILAVLQCMTAEAAGGILSKLDPVRAAKVTAAGG